MGRLLKLLLYLVGLAAVGLVGYAFGGKEAMQQAGDVGAALALAMGQMVMAVMTAFIYRQLSEARPGA